MAILAVHLDFLHVFRLRILKVQPGSLWDGVVRTEQVALDDEHRFRLHFVGDGKANDVHALGAVAPPREKRFRAVGADHKALLVARGVEWSAEIGGFAPFT